MVPQQRPAHLTRRRPGREPLGSRLTPDAARSGLNFIHPEIASYAWHRADVVKAQGGTLEHLVAASCILMSQGKLNVSTPLVDDEGVDLVFNRHDRPATLAVQIKGRSRSARLVQQGRFLADVSKRTFAPREDLYMLYVVYEEAAADYGPVWLVPSAGLAARGGKARQGNALRFATSLGGEETQWRKCRLSKKGLPEHILDVLDSLSSPGSGPA